MKTGPLEHSDRSSIDWLGVPQVLLFRPDSLAPGGVSNYFNVVLQRFGPAVEIESFVIGLRPGKLLGRKSLYPLQFFLDCLKLVLVLLRRRFDIVHLNPSLNASAFTRDFVFAVIVSALSKSRILLFFRGWEDEFFVRLNGARPTRRMLRWLCGRADRVLVLGSSIRDDLVGIGVEEDRIDITHTTFDGALIREAEGVRRDGLFTFLFMSRFIKQKGIAELLEASKILRDRGVEFRLVLAGAGPFTTTAERLIDSLNLGSIVATPGYLRGEEKGEALMNADAFVFPTYHGEGCPNCLLEAMGASLPVISTQIGGIPDIIKPPSGGILLDSVKPVHIADAMESFVLNREHWASIGAENKRVAWSTYEAGAVASYLERLYADLAS